MDSDISALKRRLRRAVAGRILELDPADRRRQQDALAAGFARLPGFARAGTVLLYATAFPEEIDTAAMLRRALAQGKRLVCPRVDRAERRLRLYLIEDLERDFRAGTLGIPEPRKTCREIAPAEVDWVLVPGLAFDARGFRLGRGAGHYDRLLPFLRPEVPRWALAFDCQWEDALPVEAHDQPLDGVVSPGKSLVRAPGAGLNRESDRTQRTGPDPHTCGGITPERPGLGLLSR
jgi:5-formyltetrahydrofolate cyclo-ligase